jgi:hypothetical protein
MKASQLKVLVLFLVLAFVAITLAGWTWDDNAALSASVPQVSLYQRNALTARELLSRRVRERLGTKRARSPRH